MRKLTLREFWLLSVILPITFPFAGYVTYSMIGLIFGMGVQLIAGLVTLRYVEDIAK